MRKNESAATASRVKPESIFVGYITPVAWDAQNKIKDISLLTADQEEIRIIHNSKADRLVPLVWEKVELTGQLQVDKHGNKKIKVHHYTTADFDSIAGSMGGVEDTEDPDDELDELKEVLGNHSWFSGFDEVETTHKF